MWVIDGLWDFQQSKDLSLKGGKRCNEKGKIRQGVKSETIKSLEQLLCRGALSSSLRIAIIGLMKK
jgi:hypothetical protein